MRFRYAIMIKLWTGALYVNGRLPSVHAVPSEGMSAPWTWGNPIALYANPILPK